MSCLLCLTIVTARCVSYENRCMSLDCSSAIVFVAFVGCTLFANKSVTHVHAIFLDALRDLTQSGTYAWGAAALMHMYENETSKSTVRQLAGYIALLQVSSNVNKTLFHWCWLLYVVSYFNEYVCKMSLMLDLQAFPVFKVLIKITLTWKVN